MKARSPSYHRGFTVIEILIVLAIATLVLLIVFLAVPSARRAERNASRKRMVGSIVAQMQQYYTDNSLALPDLWDPNTVCRFIDNQLKDFNPGQADCTGSFNAAKQCILVTGGRYDICYHHRVNSPHTYVGPLDEISIQLGHKCNSNPAGDPLVSIAAGDGDIQHFVVWTSLEPSGRVCQDNS